MVKHKQSVTCFVTSFESIPITKSTCKVHQDQKVLRLYIHVHEQLIEKFTHILCNASQGIEEKRRKELQEEESRRERRKKTESKT